MSNQSKKGKHVYLTDGAFRIVWLYHRTMEKYTYIEHSCPYSSGWNDTPHEWKGHTYTVENRGDTCQSCNQPVPEGLQAVFWILKEE